MKIICVLAAIIVIFFFENICGYFRFKELCAQEKNLQIINKIEPDVGWIFNEGMPSSRSSVFKVASLPHVKFVRFLDYDDKQLYDVSYIGANKPAKILNNNSYNKDFKEFYDVRLANLEKKPVYAWKQVRENLPNELRTGRYGDRIIDLRTEKIIVNLTSIGYGLFDRGNTLFDAPSGNTCEWYEYLGKDSNKLLIFGK